MQKIGAQILEDFGKVDILINNAGVTRDGLAMRMSIEDWDTVINTNLRGAFNFTQSIIRTMIKQRSGRIVNITSVIGLIGNAGQTNYAASKAGLIGLTKTLASEWGGRGVRVNAVCPGWIKTEMDAADQSSGAYSDQDIVDRVPMARFAHANDVAEAIAFLLDQQRGGFINGVSLPVDGGWTADASWESLRLRTRS